VTPLVSGHADAALVGSPRARRTRPDAPDLNVIISLGVSADLPSVSYEPGVGNYVRRDLIKEPTPHILLEQQRDFRNKRAVMLFRPVSSALSTGEERLGCSDGAIEHHLELCILETCAGPLDGDLSCIDSATDHVLEHCSRYPSAIQLNDC